MKNKKYIIIAVVAVIIVAAAIMITQPLKWFEKSFEAVVQETLFLVFLECFLLPVYFLPGKILVFLRFLQYWQDRAFVSLQGDCPDLQCRH